MNYFRKEVEQSPVYIFGQPFRFDLLATEDAMLIAELDKCVHRGIGGVVSITKEEYEEESKKKQAEQLSRNSLNPPQHRPELKSLNLPPDRRAVEAVANPGGRRNGMFARPQMGDRPQPRNNEPMPDPIQIPSPTSFIVPPTAKLSDLKK